MVVEHPNVIGDFTWTGWDYLGEVGIGATAYAEDDPTQSPALEREFPYLTAWCGDLDITGWPAAGQLLPRDRLRPAPRAVSRGAAGPSTTTTRSRCSRRGPGATRSARGPGRASRAADHRRGVRRRRRGGPAAGRRRDRPRAGGRAAPMLAVLETSYSPASWSAIAYRDGDRDRPDRPGTAGVADPAVVTGRPHRAARRRHRPRVHRDRAAGHRRRLVTGADRPVTVDGLRRRRCWPGCAAPTPRPPSASTPTPGDLRRPGDRRRPTHRRRLDHRHGDQRRLGSDGVDARRYRWVSGAQRRKVRSAGCASFFLTDPSTSPTLTIWALGRAVQGGSLRRSRCSAAGGYWRSGAHHVGPGRRMCGPCAHERQRARDPAGVGRRAFTEPPGNATSDSQAGFGPDDINVAAQSREQFAETTSAAVAAAAFGAQQGQLAGPIQGSFGFYVVRTERINTIPGRPLAAVRDGDASTTQPRKANDALGGSWFRGSSSRSPTAPSVEEIARAERLPPIVTTPPMTATGLVPRADLRGTARAAAVAHLPHRGRCQTIPSRSSRQVLSQTSALALPGVERVYPGRCAAARPDPQGFGSA